MVVWYINVKKIVSKHIILSQNISTYNIIKDCLLHKAPSTQRCWKYALAGNIDIVMPFTVANFKAELVEIVLTGFK